MCPDLELGCLTLLSTAAVLILAILGGLTLLSTAAVLILIWRNR